MESPPELPAVDPNSEVSDSIFQTFLNYYLGLPDEIKKTVHRVIAMLVIKTLEDYLYYNFKDISNFSNRFHIHNTLTAYISTSSLGKEYMKHIDWYVVLGGLTFLQEVDENIPRALLMSAIQMGKGKVAEEISDYVEKTFGLVKNNTNREFDFFESFIGRPIRREQRTPSRTQKSDPLRTQPFSGEAHTIN